MQYLLDTCATTEEVLEAEQKVRLEGWIFEVMHFIVCDADGNLAIIDYAKGDDGRSERRVYTGDAIPENMTALGNVTYRAHTQAMRRYRGFGGTRPVAEDRRTLDADTRNCFAYGAEMVRRFNESPVEDMTGYTFDVLQRYTWDVTRLSIVYEPAGRVIHYVSSLNRTRRTLRLEDIDSDLAGGRRAIAWNDPLEPGGWRADLGEVNEAMLDHFAERGGFDAFARYVPGLKSYRARTGAAR
jgi:hypothetical protein